MAATTVWLVNPRCSLALELDKHCAWCYLPICGFKELGNLTPVDVVSFKPQGQPSAVAVVRGWCESSILLEGIPLIGIGEEMERPTGGVPPPERR
jgi:hypothetical protein